MNDKLLEKLYKVLGEQAVNETRTLSAEQLEHMIVSCTQEIEEVKAELEANPKYQQLKEDLKAIKSGLSEVKKYNNARIQLAVVLLSERGQKQAIGE
jgi:replication initiation and membrane attachment protein DnaB